MPRPGAFGILPKKSSYAMPGVLIEGDVLVIMLALELVRALDQQVAPLALPQRIQFRV